MLRVTDDNIPELQESFDVQLVSATSDDGLVGSTNTSGASIDSSHQSSQIVILENDYPYGLLQFSSQPGVIPPVNVMILPVPEVCDIFTVCPRRFLYVVICNIMAKSVKSESMDRVKDEK